MTGYITNKTKYLVTSGCSFSDNLFKRWPRYLAEDLGLELYNRGQGSCGNDWICDTTIYQVSILLEQGVEPDEILVGVMWSGIDRFGLFINEEETSDWKQYFNTDYLGNNPVSFYGVPENIPAHEKFATYSGHGWLQGSLVCTFGNQLINEYKSFYALKYVTKELLAYNSINNWVKLQFFCESKGIKLFNMTFKNIFHYPQNSRSSQGTSILDGQQELVTKRYNSSKHLHNLINFDHWFFHSEYEGMYEWVLDNNYEFFRDGFHPSDESQAKFVKEFIKPRLIGKK